ncbi:ATP-binding protein [Desulfopila inferna]|uniref:ATP-binding protein n=1 Tax=Desulfopila inferna TaxID=468528 RepID=UPI001964CA6B|nr:ATP-binding protein [Desulfopila inferna]MBM9604878.1 GAF domain-containing protein [Desulfopila inferna]
MITGLTTSTALRHIEIFSANLASTTDLKILHDYCLSFTKNIFRLDYSTLLLLNNDRENLTIAATKGFPAQVMNSFVLEKGQGVTGLALKTCRIESVTDFHLENRFETPPLVEEYNIRSAIAVPMMLSNQVFGVLVGHIRERRIFTEEEKLVYQALANQAAVAFNNAMLITSLYSSEQKREAKIRELLLEKEKTRKLTDEFESIFTTITTGVMLLKKERHLVRCNEKLAEIFGYDSARHLENVSVRKLHLSDEKYHEFGQRCYDNLVAGKIIQIEYTMRKKDGSPFLCGLSGRAVDQSSPPDVQKGFVWQIDDITRRREMEEEILQARKLESIGILAGGIGHDYNNILSAILGNLGISQRILDPQHKVQEFLSSAMEAANRAKDLTAKLLLFTRRDSPALGSVRLQDLFKELRFEKLFRNEVDLMVDFQHGLFPIKVMPDHLKVILQNLLLNAESCTPEGGKITVTGHNVEVVDEDIPGLSRGKYVEIVVADTGGGIDEAILEKIFDPYFTTKNRDSSKGIGLGLAIVHSIVRKNQGSISVRSEKRSGTVFTVLLPAAISNIQPFNR